MERENTPQPNAGPNANQPEHEAVQHVADAHHLLKGLRARLEEHPELDEAIEKLEMALSALTVKSGALL